MFNEYQGWRGAVEPAESSPSGNEYQAYKGAVEPFFPQFRVYVTKGAIEPDGDFASSSDSTHAWKGAIEPKGFPAVAVTGAELGLMMLGVGS